MGNKTLYSKDVLETIYEQSKKEVEPRDIVLTKEDITGLAKIIEARPYGKVEITRYKKGKNDLYLGWEVGISWYTLHKTSYITWSRPRSMPNIYSLEMPLHGLHIKETYDKTEAWKELFPERYYVYISYLCRAKLKNMGLDVPPEDVYVSNILRRNYGLCLVSTWKSDNYLCSPIGCAEIEPYVNTIEGALKEIGISLPRKYENRTWEKIKPRWVMALLKK